MLPGKLSKRRHRRIQLALVAAIAALTLLSDLPLAGCGGGSAAPPPAAPPPAPVVVVVNPTSAVTLLGSSQAFSATVSDATDTRVSWAVNGITGGNASLGTISVEGLFTAPRDLPASANLTITATSFADSFKSASAQITISSDVAVAVTPGATNAELGAKLQFGAAIASAGHPDPAIRWSLSGAACPSACGTIDANGNYTAPQILPPAAKVNLTATSIADGSKQATAAITITSNFTLQLAAPASVSAGASATLVATLAPLPASNPSPQLTWSLSGLGCSAISCGQLSTTTQALGSNASPDTANYTAPAVAPNPNTVTVTVTPRADPSKRTQAVLSIGNGVSLSLLPVAATLAPGHRVTLATQISSANTGLAWSVNGIAGGDTAVGQICIAASNPCLPFAGGAAQDVDYIAPGAIPSPNPVIVQATSAADPARSASSRITVINHVLVSVQPASATLAPGASQTFTASVLGTTNQNVVWQVQGTGCNSGIVCGAIDANGIYTAPLAAPAPPGMQVLAISSEDTSQFAAASLTILSGPDIQSLHPASVYAGGANGFTLRIGGTGFVPSNPGPGSTLLIGGSARTTNCTTAGECSAPVFAADVAVPQSLTVQVRNPDGASSSSVALVVAAPNVSDGSVSLAGSVPESNANDITVVEPTTAGVDAPGSSVDLNVAALGVFSAATNACSLAGNPILITRPASGTATADICAFSQSGLDTGMTYIVSGSGDVSVIAKQPAGLGIIRLTLQVTAAAQTGARTLFLQNANLDKTAATGALEVQ